MARLDRMSEEERAHVPALPCPSFERTPWATGPALKERRIVIISTAGLHRKGDRPFAVGATDYRVIPVTIAANELVMSHLSTNFDRTGFQQDWNVVFPLDRLKELVACGEIGSLAQYHYSFMGASDPRPMEDTVRRLAGILRKDKVDSALLLPV
jgi:D-proline reductase (dithiol) PrdB